MNKLFLKNRTGPFKRIPLLFALLISVILFSCKDEEDIVPVLQEPTIEKVEVGLNNNETGVIGRDFHFNADVIAGDRIEDIQVKILQRSGETYRGVWAFEIKWPQYKDAKNANVHAHFNIPNDAIEGTYDFVIIVNDQNGTKLEEKRNISIYAPENLPVDPQISILGVTEVDENHDEKRTVYYSQGPHDTDRQLNRNEIISTFGNVSGIKGDGRVYFLMINKKHNHRPETIDAIDFSMAIVSDFWQHKDMPETGIFTSLIDWSTTPLTIRKPAIVIGATHDKNVPEPSPITDLKTWETGDYYIGIIYHNDTYNMGLFQYIEVSVNMD
ncbi:DUF4625 domain-containing protein [Anditalea andensis]|uniref:DUF4625 domain-containing protein n=1 Tax=Anditalea andensis TaxID=1048983 RepID=A0A074KZQ3_9BACT|nr:DUF4625 domain-containing protein [Anditalea andensis]KEO75476.1 hypothetical protein EL17_01085 [Anditalea andensis]